ncbi:hypothetical protein EUGRSUZ_C03495 [Eucalyptus grandis]|uniref:Uncharacterized protein n=2 Tax=Eucalyptus grandis TaxID=71139 RepID=A0A059CUR2_EUCGR|nr:hypothetical protein EUGRSUZ_C03495 [Eucalyptus grandis]
MGQVEQRNLHTCYGWEWSTYISLLRTWRRDRASLVNVEQDATPLCTLQSMHLTCPIAIPNSRVVKFSIPINNS